MRSLEATRPYGRSDCISVMSNVVDFFFQGKPVDACKRETKEQADSPFENKESITVRALYLLRRIPHCCWICDAPMSRQWLSGPNRAHFLGGVIADGEDKIELGRVLLSNSSQLLLRRPFLGTWAASSCLSASGRTAPDGWPPAL